MDASDGRAVDVVLGMSVSVVWWDDDEIVGRSRGELLVDDVGDDVRLAPDRSLGITFCVGQGMWHE